MLTYTSLYIHLLDQFLWGLLDKDEVMNAAEKLLSDIAGEYDTESIALNEVSVEAMMKAWSELFVNIIADNIQSMHNNDQNQLIQQIYKYLNDNFSQPIGLTNVSEHVNRNPSYISRFIKQATGRKFSEILAELRLEEAKKLLRSSNLKITQIAEQVGYPNLQYFYPGFTGQMNMTPAEYRKITTYF